MVTYLCNPEKHKKRKPKYRYNPETGYADLIVDKKKKVRK